MLSIWAFTFIEKRLSFNLLMHWPVQCVHLHSISFSGTNNNKQKRSSFLTFALKYKRLHSTARFSFLWSNWMSRNLQRVWCSFILVIKEYKFNGWAGRKRDPFSHMQCRQERCSEILFPKSLLSLLVPHFRRDHIRCLLFYMFFFFFYFISFYIVTVPLRRLDIILDQTFHRDNHSGANKIRR